MDVFTVVSEYINTCPYILKLEESISSEGSGYLLREVSVDPIAKKYVDGSVERRYEFIIETKDELTDESLLRISSSGFSTQFTKWLEEQNNIGNLPQIEKATCEKIEAITTGYIEDKKYKLKCRLTYF